MYKEKTHILKLIKKAYLFPLKDVEKFNLKTIYINTKTIKKSLKKYNY